MIRILRPTNTPCRFLYILASVSLLASCSSRKAEDSKNTLLLHLSADPATLDPTTFEDGHAYKVLLNVIDPLYENRTSGEIQPLLAKTVKISPDGKTYRIAIDETARWSNGDPVTAEDVAYGIQKTIDPFSKSRNAHWFDMLAEADPVQVKGTHLLEIRLKKKTPYFLKVLSLPVTPLPKKWLLAHQGKWTVLAPTNGPYFIKKVQAGQWIDLEANPFYANEKRKPKVLKARWKIIQEEQTAAQLFRSGGLHILTRVPSFEIKKLDQEGLLRHDPYAATYYLGFNVNRPPATDVGFRKRVAASINPEATVDILQSYDEAAWGWIPKGLEGYHAKSVFKRGEAVKLPKIQASVSYDASSKNTLILEKIQSDLKQNGVDLELHPTDWKSHLKRMVQDPTPIFRFAWQAPFLDPLPHLEVFTSDSRNNKTGWKNADYDLIVKRVRELSPGPERLRWIAKAEKILLDQDCIIIPIYHYVQLHAVSKNISGFSVNPFSVIPIQEISIIP